VGTPIRDTGGKLRMAGILQEKRRGMVPTVRFERTTYRLQGGCSTN
jgi:hypothetical protein